MMRMIFLLLLAFSVVLAVELSDEQREYIAQNPTIKVQNESDYIPINFNHRGKPTGYSIDYIKLLAQKVGLEVEVIKDRSWNEYLQMAQEGEIDIILNVVQNSQRQRYLNFTQPYLQLYPSIFSRQSDRINSIDQLKGKVLAVPNGYYFIPLLEENYPDIKILLTNGNLDSLRAVESGRADATVGLAYTMQELARTHFIEGVKVSGDFYIQQMDKYFEKMGVIKQKPLLYEIIQKAIESVSYEEERFLRNKWLEYSDRSIQINGLQLSKEEVEYLKQKEELKLCIDPHWMPFESLQNGKHIGMSADYIELIQEVIPIKIKLVPTKNWTQTLDLAKNRECDILSLAMKTKSRSEYLDFTQPYLDIPLVIATTNDKFFIDSIEQLEGKKVAMVVGYSFTEILQNFYPKIKIISVENVKEGLDKTIEGEVYGFIDTIATIGYQFQKNYVGELKIAGRFDYSWKLSIATRNDEPLLVGIFDKALLTIEENTKQEILNRWISISYNQSNNFKYFYHIVSVLAIVLLFLMYRQYMLKRYNNQLQFLSTHDNMTQVFNRMQLDKCLDIEIARANRTMETFCIIIFDIDDFKKINDTYGHQVGDTIVVKVAQLIIQSIRKIDIFGRWGGEEFLLIAPTTNIDGATQLTQKIIDIVASEKFHNDITITISAGIAQYQFGESEKELFIRADEALYKAKNSGKNRVEINIFGK